MGAAPPHHPLTRGHVCEHGRSLPRAINGEQRLVEVWRGGGPRAVASWEDALDDLIPAIQRVVQERGWSGIGVLIGGSALHNQRLSRSLAELRGRLGPVAVFSERARSSLPMGHASRHVLGRPRQLAADLARARHLLALGGNQPAEGWPLAHDGHQLLRRIQAGDRRRLRLTVADPRPSALARRAHDHLRLRPGSELYLLLGMLSVIVGSRWYEEQHVRERTRGLAALSRALEPWTPARTAALCGLELADITAEAMRFSRAPTASILLSPQALGTPWSSLTAWVSLLLHAVTNNLLAPGGLYAHPAPPSPSLPERADTAILRAVQAGLRVLVCVESDPVASLPGGLALTGGGLERLVCIDRMTTDTARAAHWALPGAHFLEEPDLRASDVADRHWLQWSAGLAVQPGACRPPARILEQLLGGAGGGVPPMDHARSEQQAVADLTRELGLDPAVVAAGVRPGLARTAELPRGVDGGPVDRAQWTVHHPDGRLELAAAPMIAALARHRPAEPVEAYPLALVSSAVRDPARGPSDRGQPEGEPSVGLHPSHGFAAGQRVVVRTAHGRVTARVELDEGLAPSAVDLPVTGGGRPRSLVDPAHLDPWADTPWTDGQPCGVEPVASSGEAPKPRS